MHPSEHQDIQGERATSTVSGTKSASDTMAKRGAAVVALIAAMGVFLWITSGSQTADQREKLEKITIRQQAAFEPAPVPAPPPVIQPASVIALPSPAVPASPVTDELLDSARRAPVLAFNRNTSNPNRTSKPEADSGTPLLVSTTAEQAPRNTLADKLEATVLEGARAGTLGNRNYIVAMGTSVPCVLETALSSDVPGFVSCVINRDVLSDNGRVVLMEKGTQVVGEFRAQLKRGQKRLFVLWSRAKTPKGVIVKLASPATDALGRTGFDGEIDTHFWERFGGALLMSVVGDASAYLGGKLSDQDIEIEGSTAAGKQAAAIAVEQSINIPPTLSKNQGEMVSIFVARDLDFSQVYSLRVTETHQQIYDRAVMGDFSRHNGPVVKP